MKFSKVAIDGTIYHPSMVQLTADTENQMSGFANGGNVSLNIQTTYEIRLTTSDKPDPTVDPESRLVLYDETANRFHVFEKFADFKQKTDYGQNTGTTEVTTIVTALEQTVQ